MFLNGTLAHLLRPFSSIACALSALSYPVRVRKGTVLKVVFVIIKTQKDKAHICLWIILCRILLCFPFCPSATLEKLCYLYIQDLDNKNVLVYSVSG